MTIPAFNPQTSPRSETVLTERARSLVPAAANLTPVQAHADAWVSRAVADLADWKSAATVIVAGGVLARAGSLLQGARAGALGIPSLEGALSRASSLAPHVGEWGVAAFRNLRWATAALPMAGAAALVSGCGEPFTSGPSGPQPTGINEVGSEFPLNAAPNTGTNLGFALSLNGSGTMVAAWADSNPSEPTATGVFARPFAPSGTPGDVAAADQPSGSVDVNPSVSANSRGNFVVSWTTTSGPDSPSSVRARRFDNTGRLIGATLTVIPPAVNAIQPRSSIMLLEDGGFALVSNDGSATCGACAHFFNADNSPASDVALVPSGTSVPAISLGSSTQGQWSWAAIVPAAGGRSELRIQRFNGRNPLGSTAAVDLGTLGTSAAVRAAMIPNGNAMVVWQTNTGLQAQVLDGNGTPLDAPFTVANVPAGQSFSIASDERASFIVGWERDNRIYASVFNSMGDPVSENLDVSGASGENHDVAVTAIGSGRVSIGWRRFSTEGGAHHDLKARNYQLTYSE